MSPPQYKLTGCHEINRMTLINGSQLAKMKMSIPDMSLP